MLGCNRGGSFLFGGECNKQYPQSALGKGTRVSCLMSNNTHRSARRNLHKLTKFVLHRPEFLPDTRLVSARPLHTHNSADTIHSYSDDCINIDSFFKKWLTQSTEQMSRYREVQSSFGGQSARRNFIRFTLLDVKLKLFAARCYLLR